LEIVNDLHVISQQDGVHATQSKPFKQSRTRIPVMQYSATYSIIIMTRHDKNTTLCVIWSSASIQPYYQ